jgi:ABC-type transporter Mla MlaB component
MLRIDRCSDGEVTTFRLSGRIQAKHLRGLRAQIEGGGEKTRLNLEDLRLVDRAGVQFLAACELNGVELLNCSLYIREWIVREKRREPS